MERYGKSLPEGDVAESWEVSARADGGSRIANGCWAGKDLGDVIERFTDSVLGKTVVAKTGSVFPLLFKLIDANDKLSVQVHPGDAYAQAIENEPNGKREAWYILEAAPNAEIVYGLQPGTNSERLRQMIEKNRIGDCLNTVCVKPGDVIDIAPGTIHAIGKGIVLAEIQQNSDLTYRLYDYDRKDRHGQPRGLHIEKALDVIDYAPPVPFAKGTLAFESESATITGLLSNDCFQLDLLDIHGTLAMNAGGDRFYILFVAQGEAGISYESGVVCAKMGESILIPADLGRYAVTGECRLLSMYVPLK